MLLAKKIQLVFLSKLAYLRSKKDLVSKHHRNRGEYVFKGAFVKEDWEQL